MFTFGLVTVAVTVTAVAWVARTVEVAVAVTVGVETKHEHAVETTEEANDFSCPRLTSGVRAGGTGCAASASRFFRGPPFRTAETIVVVVVVVAVTTVVTVLVTRTPVVTVVATVTAGAVAVTVTEAVCVVVLVTSWVAVAVLVLIAKKDVQNGDALRIEMIDSAGLLLQDFKSRSTSPGAGTAETAAARRATTATRMVRTAS